MKIQIHSTAANLGQSAGQEAARLIKSAIKDKGFANIILATGTSQFATLQTLQQEPGIDWSYVTMFHLDEYIGLPITHKASFRKYLQERFIKKVPSLSKYYLIDAETNPTATCAQLGELIKQHPIDVALVGIGENGHLAFNDPPADFDTKEPYLIVDLDAACRKQQWGEGWFETLDAVPKQAISMSIQQILKSTHIICSVPDERKALAVKNCLENEVSNLVPASILQTHPNCSLHLDESSALLLKK